MLTNGRLDLNRDLKGENLKTQNYNIAYNYLKYSCLKRSSNKMHTILINNLIQLHSLLESL